MVEIKRVVTKKDRFKFFKFAMDLYRKDPYVVPNLYRDELDEFDPKINDAFRFADCQMFLAYKNKKIVGRIAGIYHKGSNQKTGLKQLRFTRFDFIDDLEVSKALFNTLIAWAKELEMNEIIGPIGFSDLNEEGMLVDGFDKPSSYIEIYNYPYYVKHMEALGAYKIVDWHSFRIAVPKQHDERVEKLSNIIAKKNDYSLLNIKYLLKHDKKKLHRYFMQCLDVLDEAFADLYGTTPVNDKQKARQLKTVYQGLVPELAAVVLKDDKPVAYGLMVPSMNKVLRAARGKFFPKAIIPYIKAMNHIEVADMLSVGVYKEHANKGAVAVIMNSCLKGLIALGVKYIETGPELENNKNVQNLWKNYNPELVKVHRCWGLKID